MTKIVTLFVQNRRPRIYDKLCPRTRILPAPSIICPWSWSLTTDEVGPSRGRTVKHKIVRELVGIALGGFRVFDADLVCLAGHAFGCFQIALSLVERTEAARHLDVVLVHSACGVGYFCLSKICCLTTIPDARPVLTGT